MNNPLTVISGRSQLLARQLTDPKQKASAELIVEQAHRLSQIITDLMAFAKPQPADVRECHPADVLGRAVRDAKARHVPTDRVIEVTIGDVPAVAVDEQQVAAALAEVIDNALHATAAAEPKSGAADAPPAQPGRVTVHAAHDPYTSRVVVTVADDGCGMDEATSRRAFDPFYSQKTAGRRRGMGLAKALRWIEASGGSIRLESRPGAGTRAIILLPAAAAADPQAVETVVERKAQ
jgi:signal transduction histidine kinase